MGDDRQHQRRQNRDRQARHRAVADEIPDVGRRGGHLDFRAEADHQNVVKRAPDDEGHQRCDEGAQPQEADQIAVDRAEHRAGRHRGGEGEPDRLIEDEEHRDRGKGRQREDRAHRQVDAAAQHHHRQADHHQAELAQLAGGFLQRVKLEEARNGAAETCHHDHQRQKRDRVIGPALGQNLADDVIGHEVVAPGLQPLAEGHRASIGSGKGGQPNGSGRPIMPVSAASVAGHRLQRLQIPATVGPQIGLRRRLQQSVDEG